MLLEGKDVRSLRFARRPTDKLHIHPVDVVWHAPQLTAAVRIVVRCVRSRLTRFKLIEVDVGLRGAILLFIFLFSIVHVLCQLEGHRLHTPMGFLRRFFNRLLVEVPLALLHRKLKLSCKDPHVFMSLQAVAVRDDVEKDF